eukprot:scaffold175998_cov34-Tisochrysis_lutea.AAC.3
MTVWTSASRQGNELTRIGATAAQRPLRRCTMHSASASGSSAVMTLGGSEAVARMSAVAKIMLKSPQSAPRAWRVDSSSRSTFAAAGREPAAATSRCETELSVAAPPCAGASPASAGSSPRRHPSAIVGGAAHRRRVALASRSEPLRPLLIALVSRFRVCASLGPNAWPFCRSTSRKQGGEMRMVAGEFVRVRGTGDGVLVRASGRASERGKRGGAWPLPPL